MPLFIKMAYELYETTIYKQRIYLLYQKEVNTDAFTPDALVKQMQLLEQKTGLKE